MSYDERIVTRREDEADQTVVAPAVPGSYPPPAAPPAGYQAGEPVYQPPGYVPPAAAGQAPSAPAAYPAAARSDRLAVETRHIERRVGPGETIRRLVILLFGILQGLIVLRILLLLLAARESNDLVRGVYDLTEVFVSPFRGILAIEAVRAGEVALDVGAIVALIAWTLIELVVLAVVGIVRREPTY